MPQSAIYYLLCIAMFFFCVYCITEHDVFLESCFKKFKEVGARLATAFDFVFNRTPVATRAGSEPLVLIQRPFLG